MEPKPVQSHKPPAYPTRREVLAGAASFALAGLAGGSFVFAATEEGRITVAPVFKHGEGRGAIGCIVVSPPVFLSEEEGMQILREELAKHGIKLKAGSPLAGVRIPARLEERKLVDKGKGKREYQEELVEVPDSAKPLRLGGIDANKKIAVEFISKKGYHDFGGVLSGSTVQSYDFKGVAEYVTAQVKKQGKDQVFVGVFYDPLTNIPSSLSKKVDDEDDRKLSWEERQKRGKKKSQDQLRLQAQDFIAWLKKQKAIE
jgi:hypothetical protein